jgi:hypothetical protein
MHDYSNCCLSRSRVIVKIGGRSEKRGRFNKFLCATSSIKYKLLPEFGLPCQRITHPLPQTYQRCTEALFLVNASAGRVQKTLADEGMTTTQKNLFMIYERI